MAGECDAYVRKTSANTQIVNIPYKFWGLELERTYRAVIRTLGMHPDAPPYSFDVKLHLSGNSARITIPKGTIPIEVGDRISVWVGDAEDYGKEGCAIGRGRSKTQRERFLEEQVNLLHGHPGESVHDERGA